MRPLALIVACVALSSCALSEAREAGRALAWASRQYSTAVESNSMTEANGERGSLIDAYDAAKQVVNVYGLSYERCMILGSCAMRVGAYSEAVESFSAALRLRPNDVEARKAVSKANQYSAAATALTHVTHSSLFLKQLVQVPGLGRESWAAVLVGDMDAGYGRDCELILFSRSGKENAVQIDFTQNVNDVGHDFRAEALDLDGTGRPQVVFRGKHHFGDGGESGCFLVVEYNGRTWSPTFVRTFLQSANIERLDAKGRWSILIENPLHFRASDFWTDVFDYRDGSWLESDADHPSFYRNSEWSDDVTSRVRAYLSERPDALYKAWLIWEAKGRCEEILRHFSAALRAYRTARRYCFRDIHAADLQFENDESALSRIEQGIRRVKKRSGQRSPKGWHRPVSL